jgi:hypothetical protein
MGRTTTPKYRIEFNDNPFRVTWGNIEGWDCRRNGQPTLANIEKWRDARHASFKKGQCNDHIPAACRYVPYINHAKIVRQKTKEVVVLFTAPMFEVV